MRHILLFTLAILLPVFAFLNFAHVKNKPETETQKQTASMAKASAAGQASDIDPDASGESPSYKIPKVFYTQANSFPSTSNITQPFLERIKNPSFIPIRNWDVSIQNIDAASAISIEPIAQKVLYNKNIFDARPIASLSKIMTALVVAEEMNLSDEVLISREAVETYGDAGGLVVGELISVENLIYALLVASSNDAAVALEEYYNAFRVDEEGTFVAAMNRRAQELGLDDTFFVEPSGLNVNNRATAYDLARLADYVFQIPILRYILSVPVADVQSADGLVNHHLVNSNKLLGVLPGVIAGKTGYTEEAGESIVIFVKKGEGIDDYLIHVILGSSDRLKASRELIDWVDRAYVWEE